MKYIAVKSIGAHLRDAHTMDEIISNGIEFELIENMPKDKGGRCSSCEFTYKKKETLERHKSHLKTFPK